MKQDQTIDKANDFAAEITEKAMESIYEFKSYSSESVTGMAIVMFASNIIGTLLASIDDEKAKKETVNAIIKLAKIKADEIENFVFSSKH